MKFTTPARRVLAAGAVSALAAGALVATTTTTASAAPIQNEYLCDGPTTDFPMFLDSDIPALALVPEISAGFDVPPTFLEVQNTITVPTVVVDAISGFDRVEAPGFSGTFGPVTVGVNGVGASLAAGPDRTDNPDGTTSFNAPGSNAAFEVPAAGVYDVVSPTAITLEVKDSEGNTALTVPCALAAGETVGSYASVQVFKNDSTSVAKPTAKSFPKGKAAKVKVKVKADNQTPTGKVVLKKGKKKLAAGNLNAKGIVVLKTKALPVGKNKVKAIYKGDGYTNKSSATTTVKVVR